MRGQEVIGDVDCLAIALASGKVNPSTRVGDFNQAAPDCCCENQRMSDYSPRPVSNDEVVTRFVFAPLHVRRNGKLNSSLFSQVQNTGCSVQREAIATRAELVPWITAFLNKNGTFTWIGTFASSCSAIRSLTVATSDRRAVAVYDTAEPENPAHAELFQTQYVIDEADKIELRAELLKAFGGGAIGMPDAYRDGVVWTDIDPVLRARPMQR